jgi:hypothetical protein
VGDKKMKKKLVYLSLTLALILLQTTILPIKAPGNNNPNKVLGSPAFVLNIIGKKAGWSPNGDFDNPDRHTIFVRETGDVNISITQAPRKSLEDFAVLDGNGIDGEAALQLGDGYYAVYIAALGKPGGAGDLGSFITAPDGKGLYYIGKVDATALKPHGKTPVWEDYTNLFYITYDQAVAYLIAIGLSSTDAAGNATAMFDFFKNALGADYIDDFDGDLSTYDPAIWIFDFFDYLLEVLEIDEGDYAWELKNNGIKHLQVRFYYVKPRTWDLLPLA